jgi:hypothetical protein
MIGSGVRNETNKEQRYYLALSARPTKSWVFEAYADFESRPDDKDIQTLQAFGGYEGKSFKLGLQYARQTRQQGPGKDEIQLDVLSGFATGTINPKVLWLARVDRGLDPNPNGASIPDLPFDPTAKWTFFLAGLEFLPIPSVHPQRRDRHLRRRRAEAEDRRGGAPDLLLGILTERELHAGAGAPATSTDRRGWRSSGAELRPCAGVARSSPGCSTPCVRGSPVR